MKKYLFLLLLFPWLVSAQNKQVIDVASGEDLSMKISYQFQYLFPEFTNGDVYFNGHKGSGKLNYSLILCEMQFMENDQVMALSNVKDVLMVNIDNRKFYPFNTKEFTEELLTTSKYQLRIRRKGSATQPTKKGAYGDNSGTSAITSYSSINNGARQQDLTVDAKVVITLNYFYYLVGETGKHKLIKNVKTFTKLFPAYSEKIKVYVKEHQTQFDKEEDLKTLLNYCSKLGN